MSAWYYNFRKKKHTPLRLPALHGEALTVIASLVNGCATVEEDGTVLVSSYSDPAFLAHFPGPDDNGYVTAYWCDEIDGPTTTYGRSALKYSNFTLRGNIVWWNFVDNYTVPLSVSVLDADNFFLDAQN